MERFPKAINCNGQMFCLRGIKAKSIIKADQLGVKPVLVIGFLAIFLTETEYSVTGNW